MATSITAVHFNTDNIGLPEAGFSEVGAGLGYTCRSVADLTHAVQVRFSVCILVPARFGAVMRVQYFDTFVGDWRSTSVEEEIGVGVSIDESPVKGINISGWHDVPDAAKTDGVWLRLVTELAGSSEVTTPKIINAQLEIRSVINQGHSP
jgi:hypothetical protein